MAYSLLAYSLSAPTGQGEIKLWPKVVVQKKQAAEAYKLRTCAPMVKALYSIGPRSWGPISLSPDKSTVLIVGPSPLRNLGLVAAFDRLFAAQGFATRRLRNDGSMRTPIAA
jgi:hypothetical protein